MVRFGNTTAWLSTWQVRRYATRDKMVSPFEMGHQKVESMIANPAEEAAVPALSGHLSLNHRINLEQCCGSNWRLFPNHE
jgi:hypothetical protein